MELPFTHGKNKSGYLWLLLLWLTVTSVLAEDRSILVIKSSDNKFYDKTIQQLIANTPSNTKFSIENLETVNNDKRLLNNHNFIISLGYKAAILLNDIDHTPVIHSYLTELQFNNHDNKYNHFSILLDQPFERILNFIKILINVNTVGIIKSKELAIPASTLQKFEKNYNLKINQLTFSTGDNPVTMVRDLLKNSDVLLSLPDPEIFNRQTLKGILLTTYRQKKPVVSYSPAHVESGALAAIFTSPAKIGYQIAALLNDLLQDNKAKQEKLYYATEFDIAINYRVAKSLGLKIAEKDHILHKLKSAQTR